MNLKNYTSTVSASRTIANIQWAITVAVLTGAIVVVNALVISSICHENAAISQKTMMIGIEYGALLEKLHLENPSHQITAEDLVRQAWRLMALSEEKEGISTNSEMAAIKHLFENPP